MAVDEHGTVCQVLDVAIHGKRITHDAILGGTNVAAVRKSSVIQRNYVISETSECLIQIDSVAVRSRSGVAVEVEHDWVFCLPQYLRVQSLLVPSIAGIKFAPHHRLNDAIASLGVRIIPVICIFVTLSVARQIFERLGAELQLFVKAPSYVIWDDVPSCNANFLAIVFVVLEMEVPRGVQT